MTYDLARRALEVFSADRIAVPSTTLRSADAIDSYRAPIPFDPALDEPTDAYLEQYTFWGQAFLDPASWRHYLPQWIDYALRHPSTLTGMVVDGMLASLRPPDRNPPRGSSSAVAVPPSKLHHCIPRGARFGLARTMMRCSHRRSEDSFDRFPRNPEVLHCCRP